jgi:hypothetical protein
LTLKDHRVVGVDTPWSVFVVGRRTLSSIPGARLEDLDLGR